MTLLYQPNELSLVGYDICVPETMKDIVHSLDCLASTIDSIFDRLDRKVALERNRLSSIHKRIDICQSKVRAFRGSKKTTMVISASKYPNTEIFPLYSNVYTDDENIAVGLGTIFPFKARVYLFPESSLLGSALISITTAEQIYKQPTYLSFLFFATTIPSL